MMKMKKITRQRLHKFHIDLAVVSIFSFVSLLCLIIPATSEAAISTTQTKPQGLINVGNGEIQRRLTTLNNLASGINSAQYLSASDKSSLSNEVSTEISGLTSLQTKLDSETTVSAATTDDLNVITEYRVYILVTPKVYIIISADDQQATQAALKSFATGAQNVINTAKSNGKDVTTLQSELDDLNSQLSSAQTISSDMESNVIGLQPSDYNNDHSVLVGDYSKLQTAQTDNQAAISEANTLISGLQSL
jgi:hypothetical protein